MIWFFTKIKNFISWQRPKIFKKSFLNCGSRNRIFKPLLIEGISNISLGNDILIRDFIWLHAKNEKNVESLRIESNCEIGHFAHIVATNSVIIEESVLIADKVFISDTMHVFSNPKIPIREQGISKKSAVVIGSGSWIGENVSILGASIGKNCVIGANSVVTKDIPDYSIAVGNPAKVIKFYDFKTATWVSNT